MASKGIKNETAEIISTVRFQVVRLNKTLDGEDRDRYIRNLKITLNTSISKLSMILMFNKEPREGDKQSIQFVESLMNDFDRLFELMGTDQVKAIEELNKIILPYKRT